MRQPTARKSVHLGVLLLFAMALPIGVVEAKKVRLEVWVNAWPPKAVNEAFKLFEKYNPGVTVNVLAPGNQWDIYSKLLLRVASGTAPDLINVITPIAGLSERKLLTPLNAYLKASKTIRPGDYNQQLLDIFTVGTSTYAVPAMDAGPWMALCYNKTSFAEAGLDPENPGATLEDLKVAHLKLTRVRDGVIQKWGFDPSDSMGSIYYPETWGQVFSARITDSSNKKVFFDTPEMVKAVEYTTGFRDSTTTAQWNAFKGKAGWWGGALAKGLQAMEVNGAWTPGMVESTLPAKSTVKMGYSWMPNTKGDKMMVVGGWGFAIPKGSKNAVLAWKLIEFMAGREPSQVIFDGLGFLNGNRRTLQEISLARHPGVKWFINSLGDADRVVSTPDVPEWLTCKGFLQEGIEKVASQKTDAKSMLRAAQSQVDKALDKFYKQTAKYK